MDDSNPFYGSRLVFAVLTLVLVSTVAAANNIDTKRQFNIPAVEFPKSILEYSHQAQVEVLFLANNGLHDIMTPAIKGKVSPREALARMIAGTRLTAEFDSDHSVTIRELRVLDFDIPAGPASDTLAEWSRQSHVQLLYDWGTVHPYATEALRGRFDLTEALQRLIRTTELQSSRVNDNTYAVTRKPLLARVSDSLKRLVLSPPLKDVDEVVIEALRGNALASLNGDPGLSFERPDFDAGGASSVPEFLSTVPQVFGGGPNEYSTIGREGETNSTKGSGFNFRGLGAESTLILIDGVRPAESGTEAGWWDISLLPLAAIQRIDINPDNASTRYGSDAISAVVNFETRKDFSGAETQLQFSNTTSGGMGERRVAQLLGHRWDDGNVNLIVEYDDRDNLPATARGQATSDLRPWGGGNWDLSYGYPGTLMTTSGQTWAITGVSDGKPILGAMGSSNTYDYERSVDILPWQQRMSTLGNASILFGDVRMWSSIWLTTRHATGLEGDFYGGTIAIPFTNPGYVNPLGGGDPVYVQYGFNNLLGPGTSNLSTLAGSASAGLVVDRHDWQLEVSGNMGLERDRSLAGGGADFTAFEQALSSTDPTKVLNPFAPRGSVSRSVLNTISQVVYYQSYSRTHSIEIDASGRLPTGWGPYARFFIGADYREESLSSYNPLLASLLFSPWKTAGRDITSIFSKVSIPLIGQPQSVPWVDRLEISLGTRYERYSDGYVSTSPTVSLDWSPWTTLTLRGTFRQGFRPPALSERNTTENYSEIIPLPGSKTAIVEGGGDPNLRAEKSRNWTGKVEFEPNDSVRISATYYNVVSTDRILQPSFAGIGSYGFDGPITDNPTPVDIAEICGQSQFLGGAQATCTQTPVDLFLDARFQSLEHLSTSGIESTAQLVATDNWKLRVDSAYILQYRGVAPGGLVLEELNTMNNPVNLRERATATHADGPVSLSGSVNYTNHYWDTTSQPRRRIGSWTTVDATMTYKPAESSALRGAELLLTVRNLMDRQPPFANNGIFFAGWDPANGGNLEGRVISGQVRWTW